MDRKIIFLVIILALAGCKQHNWIDWKTQNEMWLEANKSQPGVKTTDTGLQYKIIADPTPQDALPNSTSTVVCDYTLSLINGCEIQTQCVAVPAADDSWFRRRLP